MNRFISLSALFLLFFSPRFAQSPSQPEIESAESLRGAVSRLLSYPAYTGWDEKILNRAGDSAAVEVIRTVSIEDLKSPEKVRKVLLILDLAFAAPQLIASDTNRRPTAAILLLDEIKSSYCGQETCNEVENVRYEILHNSSTGAPLKTVTLAGETPFDADHTRWVASVLSSVQELKLGMTRQDLLRVFTTEGGLSTSVQRTYVLKGCPYIKVDVHFKPVGRPERDSNGRITFVEDARDIITAISRPYLAWGIAD